ncbi:MAG TPA: DUF924 family protein [Povalibacter sp.]
MTIPENWPEMVIRFWFGELKPEVWFTRNEAVDAAIRERFVDFYEWARTQRADALVTTAQRALAAVIVLDQFPRNLFRNSPQAFATDTLALDVSQRAISAAVDQELTRQQRVFLYMPFQHSEERAVQVRSIELFSALGDQDTLGYARKHKDVIDRFGRYPHRNATLGRASTPEEVEFLRTHSGF